MESPRFAVGDTVRLVARPSEIGVILAEPRCLNGKYSYRVNLGGRRIIKKKNHLEPCAESNDPGELFIQGSYGDRESCLLYLAYLRANGELSNYVYSFFSSRTRFYVHQFKPLIKLLDSQQGRILLSDEVGLGKTIEAGLVLIEMVARRELERALVVCPAKLRPKWRRELLTRFDLDFPILGSAAFLGNLRELGNAPRLPFQGIVSYEAVRTERVRNALADSGVSFDIVIADEAHRLRNSETNQHAAGELLAAETTRLLLLTATPVNNTSQDLFNLLRLLDPGLFRDYELFERMRQTNAKVVEMDRVLRNSALPLSAAPMLMSLRELEQGRLSELFRGNYFLERLKDLLERGDIDDRAGLVEAQRLVTKINLLSSHIARTRRVDVEERRPQRAAHLHAVQPTAEEKMLYDAVTNLLMKHYSDFRLPVMTTERMLASCMPAFVSRFLDGDEDAADELEDVDDARDEAFDGSVISIPGLAAAMREYGRPILQGGIDSKLQALLRVLRELDQIDPECKILIFSYYKKTISYLQEKLSNAGYENVIIHGDVPTYPDDPARDERGKRQELFADPDSGVRIMISSEVGSEGLDFQFSHVVVNYDLPWNPMRVEQRIGRVDRIGQQSEKLLIYSVLLGGTIDEVIYRKLLMKIGIFEQCLGDIESILGDEIRTIRDAVFDPSLTPEEKAQRAENAALVLEKRVAEARELEKDSAKIIGADQFIRDQVQRVLSSRRYVGPDEVQMLVHNILTWPDFGLNIEEVTSEIYRGEVTQAAKRLLDRYLGDSRQAILFRGRLREGGVIQWTYDYDIAASQPGLELFNGRHPAVRAILDYLADNAHRLSPVFRVEVSPDDVPTGSYALGVISVQYDGTRAQKELLALGWDCQHSECLDPVMASGLLGHVIEACREIREPLSLDRDAAKAAIDSIESQAIQTTEARRREIEGEENAILQQRRRQISDQAKRLIEAEERRKAALAERTSAMALWATDDELRRLRNLIRGAETRIEKCRDNASAQLDALPQEARISASWVLSSVGLVDVVRAI